MLMLAGPLYCIMYYACEELWQWRSHNIRTYTLYEYLLSQAIYTKKCCERKYIQPYTFNIILVLNIQVTSFILDLLVYI